MQVWTPYRNLYFLSLIKTRKSYKKASEEDIQEAAGVYAEKYVHAGFPRLDVWSIDSMAGDIWPDPTTMDLSLFEGVSFSPELEAFVLRGRRPGRQALDRLILAYSALGYLPEQVYEETYEDMQTMPMKFPLSKEDVFNYGVFYWDFATLYDLTQGADWLVRQNMDTEANILNGALTLNDVRAVLGVERGMDFNRQLKIVTLKNQRAMERVMDDMLSMQSPADLSSSKTEYLRNVAAFVASAVSLMKLHKETTRGEGDGKTLADTIQIRLRESQEEAARLANPPDWMSLERRDVSIADIADINASSH